MPKGVMLTHDNMTYYMQTALKDALKDYEAYPGEMVKGEERIISYLPLSHVAA
jgi:long-subunit acyl-CoA synthetase (AMP-forming)